MDFIVSLAAKFPVLMTIFSIMGMLRFILKPTFSYLHQVLGAVGASKIDSQVTIVEQSAAVKYLFYVLDWVASIKLSAPSVIVAPPQVVAGAAIAGSATVTQTVTETTATVAAPAAQAK